MQNLTSSRSFQPGVWVISRARLAAAIQEDLQRHFSIKLLNQAISIYSHRGYAISINHGNKKWNLIAERVPAFLDWFYLTLQNSPQFIDKLEAKYEAQSIAGMRHYRKKLRP